MKMSRSFGAVQPGDRLTVLAGRSSASAPRGTAAHPRAPVLFLGAFPRGAAGSRVASDEVARNLALRGWTILTASKYPRREVRLAHLTWTTLSRRRDYCIAHVDVFSGLAFLQAELLSLLLQRLGKPYVLTLRGGNLPEFARRWPARTRRLLRSAAAVTVPSPYLLEAMRPFGHVLKLLPNGLHLSMYKFRLRDRPGPRLVWLRAFHRMYNPVLAARVLALVARDFGGARLTTVQTNGLWTAWLLRTPDALVVNSLTGWREMTASGLVSPERLCFLPNVIDLSEFDGQDLPAAASGSTQWEACRVILVGRLFPVKRADRFLQTLVFARRKHPRLEGLIVGDGPERGRLERLALRTGLAAGGVRFLGQRTDVPTLLGQADLLVSCSDREGFPNVVLEAMAARLPVITTPAGDSGIVVQDGVTGYVVPFDDVPAMANRLVDLARSPDLRRRFGEAGRRRVEQHYAAAALGERPC